MVIRRSRDFRTLTAESMNHESRRHARPASLSPSLYRFPLKPSLPSCLLVIREGIVLKDAESVEHAHGALGATHADAGGQSDFDLADHAHGDVVAEIAEGFCAGESHEIADSRPF